MWSGSYIHRRSEIRKLLLEVLGGGWSGSYIHRRSEIKQVLFEVVARGVGVQDYGIVSGCGVDRGIYRRVDGV